MAKSSENIKYDALRADIAAAAPRRLYVLYGEERYLLERCAADLRKILLSDGESSFNYSKYEQMPSVEELREAVETFPFFAERTLVEVSDCNFTGLDELLPILRDLPEHVCLLFVGNANFTLDKRLNAVKELAKLALVVNFELQEQSKLLPWIRRHFKDAGRQISPADAEYLAFLTGGLMANLLSEIEKVAAHTTSDTVTRADIDALVTTTPEVELYKFTDAVAARDFRAAASVLATLFAMREAPHRISYSLTAKLRQLLLARLYLDEGRGAAELMKTAGIRYDWQARNLLSAARKISIAKCKAAIALCCDAAFALNDGGGEDTLIDLLLRLAAL
ncbi:MAG: DNA polymerase III subunit delta [Oscillospiraceae bacterium]|jgi:DNA polymerase-3 subunit delta|nr:DNA polymerase III subunit delta [Oscillospiraceae bacterium]